MFLTFIHYLKQMYQSKWAASSEFGTYRLCEQRRFRRACAFAQSRQNLRCSFIQAVSQEEPSDRKPDPWPLWMAGHAQLNFVMTECSKTQIRLTRSNLMILKVRSWTKNRMIYEPRHDKTNKASVRPAKTQILGVRPVWSESSLSAWRKLWPLATHWAHSENSAKTGRTVTLLVLSCRGSYFE